MSRERCYVSVDDGPLVVVSPSVLALIERLKGQVDQSEQRLAEQRQWTHTFERTLSHWQAHWWVRLGRALRIFVP